MENIGTTVNETLFKDSQKLALECEKKLDWHLKLGMNVYVCTEEDLDRVVQEYDRLENTMFLILFPMEERLERYDGYNFSDIQMFTYYWTALQVYDVDTDNLEKYGLTEDTYFQLPKSVFDHIKYAYNENSDIVCFDGRETNLSSACAAAILEFFYGNGIAVFNDGRYTPNKLLYKKMLGELRKNEEECI